MRPHQLLRRLAHPVKLTGPAIEAPLEGVVIGEVCEIQASITDSRVIGRAQVVGFRQDMTLLNLMGSRIGMSRDMVLAPTGDHLSIWVSDDMLGSVVNPLGESVDRFATPVGDSSYGSRRDVETLPPAFNERASIDEPLLTGVRAIDALLTCGIGQRLGIFAAAGCGKTSLMNMLIDHTEADVFVIGLIGERGREVTEFVEMLRHSPHRDRCVLVFATSDTSSMDRCNAALVATTVAEHFRDAGKRVVLLLDSLTRYARALRDVALAAGEMPARRGYPVSVFDTLPRVLERPGKTHKGSITAFYTVLLENEEEPDPLADEVRSILDGHIYLSRKLAEQGHFPAIDVLKSLSRVASHVIDDEHQQIAHECRRVLAKLEEMQLFVDLGEYRPGENPENDRAMSCRPELMAFLRQSPKDGWTLEQTLSAMHDILA